MSDDLEPVCGCPGYTNPTVDEVEIPGKGTRTVGDDCRGQMEVNTDV